MDEKYQQILNNARKTFRPLILDDGANFLFDFVKRVKPKNILEIGTAVGYSASLMLDANKEAKIVTIEKSEEAYLKAKQNFLNFGYSDKVTQILGDAAEEIKKINQTFDLIFLDGPKGQYFKYLPHLLNLLNRGGYLIADNVLFKGKVKAEGFVLHKHRTIVNSLRLFLNEIQTNKNLSSEIFEIGDGISVTKKL